MRKFRLEVTVSELIKNKRDNNLEDIKNIVQLKTIMRAFNKNLKPEVYAENNDILCNPFSNKVNTIIKNLSPSD